ncbi:thioredoxin [Halobacteriovorax marinus]|uniref:Thioredoxin n=1 Tax=Halobacteriovorax marinus TaxID=97084 RepID=A0A1Y5F917_9BACT|nr:thioredoxin [Halobacteriovorax marinus]
MTTLHTVTSADFNEKVLLSNKTVLVDFYADWCGPCKALAPTLNEIANEQSEATTIVKVDVDASQDLAAKYGVRGMPTMLIFKDGEIKGTLVGNQPKQTILSSLSQA